MGVIDIDRLKQNPHSCIEGMFRVQHPRKQLSRLHTPFHTMTLMNITGQIPGYAWPERYRGIYVPKENDIVHVSGKTKIISAKNKLAIDLYNLTPAETIGNPFEFLSEDYVIDRGRVLELIDVIEGLTSMALKRFIYDVFVEDDMAISFVTGKGSHNHHHSEKGGLLCHSLEAIRFLNRMTELPVHEREVGIVAALTHDVTKIYQNYNVKGNTTPMLRHDTRTLELLAGPLRKLDQAWPDGAGLLRMALEFPLNERIYRFRRLHVPLVVNLVWWADQYSAALYKEQKQYKRMASWQHYGRNEQETFWRSFPEN